MTWFGQYAGTTYTGQWWGDLGATPTPETGRAQYVPGYEWTADEVLHRLKVRELAEEVFHGKPPPAKQQDAVADAARALLAGEYTNEDEAARALEREAARQAWQWGQLHLALLQRYRDGLAQMEQERQARIAALELQRKRNQQAIAVLMMLAH